MTPLDQLITQQVAASVQTTVVRLTDRIADSMAEELLRDPSVRAHLLALVHAAFERAWRDMNQNGGAA